MPAQLRLCVVVLTHNEEQHIERALQSVAGIASEVFVIDSGSTDRTTEIARRHGATVLFHPFVNQARQFQWALDQAPITAAWIMSALPPSRCRLAPDRAIERQPMLLIQLVH